LTESAIRDRHGKVGQSIAASAAVVDLSNRRFVGLVLPIGPIGYRLVRSIQSHDRDRSERLDSTCPLRDFQLVTRRL
jgi:hypothetical protein